MLWSYKKCQKIGVARGLGRVRAKSLLAQTIPDKVFGTKCSNPAFGQVYVLEGRLGTRLCVHPNLRLF